MSLTVSRAKISSEIPTQNQHIGSNNTGFDHVFLNAPSNRPSAVSIEATSSNNNRPTTTRSQTQYDPFQAAISRLRNAPISQNASTLGSSSTRITFPALPPPPDTRPQARPTFRPPPHPDTYRRPSSTSSIPSHFGPQLTMMMANTTSSPASTQHPIPLPATPEMNPFSSLDELEELLGTPSPSSSPPCTACRVSGHLPLDSLATASPSKSGLDLPDFGVFGPHANDGAIPSDHARLPSYPRLVANMLLVSQDIYGTPQLLQTPSLVEASPDLELIAPLYGNRKQHVGTPSMANLTLTPTMASPHTSATGLYDMPGHFGFIESNGGASMFDNSNNGMEDILSLVNTFNNPPAQPTISPSDVYLTPNLYTPGPLLDTPSVGNASPLIDTPGNSNIPLSASAAHHGGGFSNNARKRASPLDHHQALLSPAKRTRSEEMDSDAQMGSGGSGSTPATKKRKHTGTRPGISSTQLLAPGAPPQMKTYLTESSTSRKDVPASYKVKPGENVDPTTINKIVAKRTANRDSARRSRQRKQQAMELAQNEINYLNDRVAQLEHCLRENGIEPPPAPMRSPPQEYEEELE
ncbi:hypothetical protein M408DRAFT_175914 [Serendipita vermifera MAFF 305830]|uniref:BZIP domain-containing protein n=1 Tax=Serendipita vermifera MAFF 305830 TaxID=933852 RepID=A0A0C2XCZ1_SERVB|nr:hypothetical protein M408DRAFT_175914 [Serendipita vermifera MAFF 305830]